MTLKHPLPPGKTFAAPEPVDLAPFASTVKTLRDRGVPIWKIADFFVCARDEVISECVSWHA